MECLSRKRVNMGGGILYKETNNSHISLLLLHFLLLHPPSLLASPLHHMQRSHFLNVSVYLTVLFVYQFAVFVREKVPI